MMGIFAHGVFQYVQMKMSLASSGWWSYGALAYLIAEAAISWPASPPSIALQSAQALTYVGYFQHGKQQ